MHGFKYGNYNLLTIPANTVKVDIYISGDCAQKTGAQTVQAINMDFDRIYERKNTDSVKYNFACGNGVPQDALPMWVADMDFKSPDCVAQAIKARAEHGIFGYSAPSKDYFVCVADWFAKRHSWAANPDKFLITAGVVSAISAIVCAMTKEGDTVIICQPVYYPFAETVRSNSRILVVSELINDGGYYTIDFEDFERKIIQHGVKLFILCNPHNPVGRVWTKEELDRLGSICLRHGVFVISDEIHLDFTFGCRHTAFAAVRKEFEDICAVCTAPTKTFNLAGLHISNIYIADDSVRGLVSAELAKRGCGNPNIMGIVACRAAYERGGEWLDELLAYLKGNIEFAKRYVDENLPEISLLEPQGTYLLWLDMRKLGFDDASLSSFMLNEAKLWLDDGYIFGDGGSGFERMNIACPRTTLKSALERLKSAVCKLRKK